MKHVEVVIAFRAKGGSHNSGPYHAGGLACNALHSAAVLAEMGVSVRLAQVGSYEELLADLKAHPTPTHLVIEAIWLTVGQVQLLAAAFPKTQVVVRAHSKMGFLQVEPDALLVMRGILALGTSHLNVRFASNNYDFSQAVSEVYGPCLYLPNLYDLNSSPEPVRHAKHGPLKIASFGATRLLKLHSSAAMAALQIAKRLGRPLEFHINVDKTPGGESVRRSIRNMFVGLPNAKLVEVGWQDSETFKETIAQMDLVIQLSCTETFCMVAADAVAAEVPLVAGPAITWLPLTHLVQDVDDTSAVAERGVRLLQGHWETLRERRHLVRFVKGAKEVWETYLRPRWWY